MKKKTLAVLFAVAVSFSATVTLISSCTSTSEFESYGLVNPTTGEKQHCLTPPGVLSRHDNDALHECLAGWEAKGFMIIRPERVPPASK